MEQPGGHILIVDDEPLMRELIAEVLGDAGYVVREAPDGSRAIEALRQATPDLMLLDLRMAGVDGWGVLAHVATLSQRPRVLVMTGRGEIVPPGKLAHYITGHLLKPFQVDELFRACETALRARDVDPASGTRKEPRRNYLAQAALVSESGADLAPANLVQVSEHGFRVESELSMEPGDPIHVALAFPGREKPVRLSGRVRWREGSVIGAEIEYVTADDATLLRELISGGHI